MKRVFLLSRFSCSFFSALLLSLVSLSRLPLGFRSLPSPLRAARGSAPLGSLCLSFLSSSRFGGFGFLLAVARCFSPEPPLPGLRRVYFFVFL